MRTSLLELYLTFLRVGGLTFGGGYAMLPMLQREVIVKHRWVTEQELLDIYAIAQCTPGIIAINTATMIGYRRRKLIGAIVATLGQVTPSLIIITLIASILSRFQSTTRVLRAFDGIRIVVCALIAQAVIGLLKKSIVDPVGVVILAITLALTLVFSLSPIIIIALASTGGILLSLHRRRP